MKTPLENSLVYSSVHISALDMLKAIDQIGGVCDLTYIKTPGLLARAREELVLADQYTATVVNQEVDDCARQLYEIIRARQEG